MEYSTAQAIIGGLLGFNTLLLGILVKTSLSAVSEKTCNERRATCPGSDLIHHSHEGLDPDARVILTTGARAK